MVVVCDSRMRQTVRLDRSSRCVQRARENAWGKASRVPRSLRRAAAANADPRSSRAILPSQAIGSAAQSGPRHDARLILDQILDRILDQILDRILDQILDRMRGRIADHREL